MRLKELSIGNFTSLKQINLLLFAMIFVSILNTKNPMSSSLVRNEESNIEQHPIEFSFVLLESPEEFLFRGLFIFNTFSF
jgi:hypothetical protein